MVAQGTWVVIPCVHAKGVNLSLSTVVVDCRMSEHSAALIGCHLFLLWSTWVLLSFDPLPLGLGLCVLYVNDAFVGACSSMTLVIKAQTKARPGQPGRSTARALCCWCVCVLHVSVGVEVDDLC
jgi:hypothetical protein